SVRLNNGSGSFSGSQEVNVGLRPIGLVLGDIDSDGDLDLLTANSASNGTVSVRLNNSAGTFSGTTEVLVANTPHAVALGDVDADGDLDLLAANTGTGSVSVRLNS